MAITEPQLTTPGTAEAAAMLRGEMGRVDGKASLLLALAGAVLAGVTSAAPQHALPTVALAVGRIGAAALVAAMVLLLIAVRPSLAGTGWPTWHRAGDTELAALLHTEPSTDEIRILQAAARRKYRRVRAAVDSIQAGVGCLVMAVVLTAVL
ncbi:MULTISPECIES: Pycsar system effector family protein [Streptomyces]|uniref:Pycsar system effector family protein n=1 Tax=Streptomyces TaxID=1883 RepID=UPI0004CCD9DE|nr:MULTISPECIES: Pycsar system effector family protein [Streptomyces]KOT51150.1 hypothetical protein ADK43_32665 [Streptomyces rimosus subsp. rimosus]